MRTDGILGDLDAGEVSLDLRSWPIIVHRVPKRPTVQALDAAFDRFEEMVLPRGRFCGIVDVRRTSPEVFLPRTRQHVARRYDRVRTRLETKLICEAYLLDGAIARGLLTAIRWLSPPNWPTQIFATLPEGVDWSKGHLDDPPSGTPT